MSKKKSFYVCFLKKPIKKLIILIKNGVSFVSGVVYHEFLCEYSFNIDSKI